MNYIKNIKRTFTLLLAFMLILSVSGCGNQPKAPYRVVGKALYTDKLTVIFRKDDPISQIVSAALAELSAGSDLAELSAKWLDSRDVSIKPNDQALSTLPEDISIPEERTFIIGFDVNTEPRAAKDAGSYTGFDIDLASRMCAELGWKLRFQPIMATDVKIELNSGNIDCAWGFSTGTAADLSSIDPYLDSQVVFSVSQESQIKRTAQFKDKVLYVSSQLIKDYIETSEDYTDIFARIRVLDGPAACFKALDAGECDVVAVERLSLEYHCR